MPKRAKSICRHPACGVLLDSPGYCAKHVRAIEAKRENSSQRGYGHKWRKAREGFLRSYPLCVKHEARGQIVLATVVDHIVPHRGDKELFWDRSNWQPLCKQCHDIKTATEDGGFGRG